MRKTQLIFWTICLIIGLTLGYFYNLSKKKALTPFEPGFAESAKESQGFGEILEKAVVEKNSASLTIDFGDGRIDRFLNLKANGEMSALEVLRSLGQDFDFEVETVEASFGEFIQEIGDVGGNTTHYWAFWVNGNYAPVGAGSYIVQLEDRIEFKLTKL